DDRLPRKAPAALHRTLGAGPDRLPGGRSVIVDAHIHVQPWRQMRPGARERMSQDRLDLDLIRSLFDDPAAFLRFLDAQGIDRAPARAGWGGAFALAPPARPRLPHGGVGGGGPARRGPGGPPRGGGGGPPAAAPGRGPPPAGLRRPPRPPRVNPAPAAPALLPQ